MRIAELQNDRNESKSISKLERQPTGAPVLPEADPL